MSVTIQNTTGSARALPWARRFLRRFSRSRSGATAVEFALLAPTFIVLIYAVIELGIRYYVYSQFEQAVFDQANLLQNPATRPGSASQVRTNICGRVAMISCGQGGFFVEVAPLTAAAPAAGDPIGDSYVIAPNTTTILRVVFPWSGVLPVSVFQMVGPLTPGMMRASVFFPAR